jgi:heat shock protein 5
MLGRQHVARIARRKSANRSHNSNSSFLKAFPAGFFFFCMVWLTLMSSAQASASASSPKVETQPRNVIGIDLGTTYSCVGMHRNGQVEIISNDMGNRITPSYVSWDATTGERYIGDAAKARASFNPANTIFDTKRLIGRQFSDPTVQADRKLMPYKIVDQNGQPFIEVTVAGEEKRYAPEEISAMVLSKMRSIAEKFSGEEIDSAVVTVPAYFDQAQRQATMDAGRIAGLKVERIINEPTAAAIAYGLNKVESGKERTILVYDLGGGTFDVTLMTVDNGVFEVHATSGDTHLGGEDFDQRVLKYMAKQFQKSSGVDISSDAQAMQRLRKEVERAKRSLSSNHKVRLEIDSLKDGIDFSEELTRSKFESLNMDLFKKTLEPVAQVLKDAKMRKTDVDEIVMVGGSTRVPMVKQIVRDFFGGKQPNDSLNPDEAVAYGAAVLGGIIGGQKDAADMLVLDVTPLSLGIETVGGVMTSIIPRSSTTPTRKSQVFSTNQDNQQTVTIRVYEGERKFTKDNHLLGSFELTGIPPAPRGVPQIEVNFAVDVDSILEVTAVDKATGKQEAIKIKATSPSGLTEEKIKAAIAEAEKFKEEDERAFKRVNALQELENYCYSSKRLLHEQDDKLDASDAENAMGVIQDTISWLDEFADTLTLDELLEKRQELESALNPIISHLYSSSSSNANQHDFDDTEDWAEEDEL